MTNLLYHDPILHGVSNASASRRPSFAHRSYGMGPLEGAGETEIGTTVDGRLDERTDH